MDQAKDLHENPETVFVWFHWWLLPHFETLKQQGMIKKGKKKTSTFVYEGYLDKDGESCGLGIRRYADGSTMEATWIDSAV